MRTISTPYIQNNTISVLALDPTLDGLISGSIQHTEHGSYLALDPEKSQKILMTLNKEALNVGKKGLIPILLTSPVTRAYMKRLSERYMPDLIVLSHNEIPPDVTIKNMGMVRIDAS
jgi:flagellar biosynthesis protein FlhA